jgi:hypothetical protein
MFLAYCFFDGSKSLFVFGCCLPAAGVNPPESIPAPATPAIWKNFLLLVFIGIMFL